MNETAQLLFSQYGLPAVAIILALGQFGVPLPTSFGLLMVGAFAAQGDTDLMTAFGWTFIACICGDQSGYFTGRFLSRRISETQSRWTRKLDKMVEKARPILTRWGGTGVFLTRWLFTPVGPALNVAAGATRLPWAVFTFWGFAGEAIWVTIYLALGYLFSSNIETLANVLANASLALVFATVAALIGWRLYKILREIEAAKH